jgi:hypothetical protein
MAMILLMAYSLSTTVVEAATAKEALRESEQRFRLFMQHFPGLAYIKDAATHVLFANQGFMGSVPLSGPKPLWAYSGMSHHILLGGTRKLSNLSIVQM